jgi:hypothetical protein
LESTLFSSHRLKDFQSIYIEEEEEEEEKEEKEEEEEAIVKVIVFLQVAIIM